MNEVEIVAKCCNEALELDNVKLSDEYYYQSLSLCVIDAIFSIGVRYTITRHTVIKYCDFYRIKRIRDDFNYLPSISAQETISKFIEKIEQKGIKEFTNEVLKNRQRTSSRNGILKTEAVLSFAKILKEFNVEYLQDMPKIIYNDKFEEEIKKIKGQSSGISLKYFFMLAGSNDYIKPDRMIIRFLEKALNRNVKIEEAQKLVNGASKILKARYPSITPRILDHQIWRKMSLGKTAETTTYISCSIIIHDNKDKILIAQRSKSKKYFPLLWETVGGALERDETPEECIRREVKEELNCNIIDLKLFNVYIINEDNRYVLIVYTGKINEPIQHNSEIEQTQWIDKCEIEKFDFYGNELEKLLDYYTKE